MAGKRLNETEDFCIPLCDSGYEGAWCVAESLRERARELCEKQGMALPTRQILFLYDKTPCGGGPVGTVMILPQVARDLFYQATGCLFTAALVVKQQAMKNLREAQFSNELYHCLRHFAVSQKTHEIELVRRHGVEQWKEQAPYSNGLDGFPEDAPNLFDERIYPLGVTEKKGGSSENANGNAPDRRTEAAPGLA